MRGFKVRTGAGLDAGRPEGELGVGVVDHLVGLGVVECHRWTSVFAGAVVVQIPAGLERTWRDTQRVNHQAEPGLQVL